MQGTSLEEDLTVNSNVCKEQINLGLQSLVAEAGLDKNRKNKKTKKNGGEGQKRQHSDSSDDNERPGNSKTMKTTKTQGTQVVGAENNTGSNYRGLPRTELRFKREDRAPYKIALQRVSERGEKPPPLRPIQISRLLDRAGIKFDQIKPITRNSWDVIFNSRSAANQALSNPYLAELKLKAYLPSYQLTRKGTVNGIPLEMSIEEILRKINVENTKVKAIEGRRLQRRIRNEGKTEWIDTETVCITFRRSELPRQISLEKILMGVRQWIPSVRMCYKCGMLGHTKNYCKETEERCLVCNERRHQTGQRCENTPRCTNCLGQHGALDRECPQKNQATEIYKIMAYENISYIKAKRLQETEAGRREKILTPNDFPPLNPRDEQNGRMNGTTSSNWHSVWNKRSEGQQRENVQGRPQKDIPKDWTPGTYEKIEKLAQLFSRVPDVELL